MREAALRPSTPGRNPANRCAKPGHRAQWRGKKFRTFNRQGLCLSWHRNVQRNPLKVVIPFLRFGTSVWLDVSKKMFTWGVCCSGDVFTDSRDPWDENHQEKVPTCKSMVKR